MILVPSDPIQTKPLMIRRSAPLLAFVVLCGGLTPTGAASAAALSLETFFQGRLTAVGTLENFREKAKRDFTIAMQASWSGKTGTLVEEVAFADGERQHKVWTFDKIGAGRFIGHREDLTREAEVSEDSAGVHMTYKARTRVPSGDTFNLAFDDHLSPAGPNAVAVRSDISYFFIPAAQVTMTITKMGSK
jgi:hypothetical protein